MSLTKARARAGEIGGLRNLGLSFANALRAYPSPPKSETCGVVGSLREDQSGSTCAVHYQIQ